MKPNLSKIAIAFIFIAIGLQLIASEHISYSKFHLFQEDSAKIQKFKDRIKISPVEQLFFTVSAFNSEIKEYGLKAFKSDLTDEKNISVFYKSLSKKDEDIRIYGYENFKADIMGSALNRKGNRKLQSHIFPNRFLKNQVF